MSKPTKTKVLRARVDENTADIVEYLCSIYHISLSQFLRDAVSAHIALQYGKAKLEEER